MFFVFRLNVLSVVFVSFVVDGCRDVLLVIDVRLFFSSFCLGRSAGSFGLFEEIVGKER